MADIIRCQWVEAPLNGVIGGVLSGGMALLSAVGAGGQDPDEKRGYVGVTLTLSGEEKEEPVTVRFGDFLLGMSRTNKKYGKYLGELTRFMDYLAERYPNCERVLPPPEEEKPLPEEPSGAAAEELPEPVEEVPAQPVMEFNAVFYIDRATSETRIKINCNPRYHCPLSAPKFSCRVNPGIKKLPP